MPLFGNKQPTVPYEELQKRLDKAVTRVDKHGRMFLEEMIRRSPNPKLVVNNELVIKELAAYLDQFSREMNMTLLPPQSRPQYQALIQRIQQGKATPYEEQQFLQN